MNSSGWAWLTCPRNWPNAHGIHLGTAHPVQLAQQRTDRPVDIHELSFVAIEHDRSPGPRRPTAPRTRHAPDVSGGVKTAKTRRLENRSLEAIRPGSPGPDAAWKNTQDRGKKTKKEPFKVPARKKTEEENPLLSDRQVWMTIRTPLTPEARLVLEHEPYWASAQFNLIQDGSQRLGKFFSTLPVPPDRSWGGAYRERSCATHAGPTAATPPRRPLVGPGVAPTLPELARVLVFSCVNLRLYF